jgi:hypothetical protein
MSVKAAGAVMAMALGSGGAQAQGPVAPAPSLEFAFSVKATLAAPVELGEVSGGRRRFIAITGGTVDGPMLKGTVLASGGDWQSIMPGGLTKVEARYFLKATDGTVIEVTNPGVRVASAEVTEKLAKGEKVDPSAYYFRTTPHFDVKAGAHEWMGRSAFVARGVRMPDHVMIDFYLVR